MKVFAYLRKSTEGDDEQIHSLETQRRIVDDFAKSKTLKIDEYIEEEKTAFKAGVRPLFNAMLRKSLEMAKKGEEVHIIFWKVSRLGRNRKDADLAIDAIEAGVHFHFSEGDFPDNASGRKMLRDKISEAIYYSDNLSEDVRGGQATSISRGLYPGAPKTGYLSRPDTRTPRKSNPDESWKIKEAFERISHGETVPEIVTWLQETVKLKNFFGTPACRSTIYHILRDPFYCGKFVWKGEIYEGKHEKIISPHLFQQVQDILDGKRFVVVKKNIYIFSLLVFLDGELLTGSRNKGIYYYFSKKQKKCFREDEIEKAFAKMLSNASIKEEALSNIREEAKELLQIKRTEGEKIFEGEMQKVAHIERRIQNAENLLLDGAITPEFFQKSLERLEKDKKDILETLPKKSSKNYDEREKILFDMVQKIQQITRDFCSFPREKKARIARLLISSLELDTTSGNIDFTIKKESSMVFELSKILSGRPPFEALERFVEWEISFELLPEPFLSFVEELEAILA